MPGPERDLVKRIFVNFWNSLKPKVRKGTLMGEDVHGNKYFEIPADRSIAQKQSRWFEPSIKNKFDAKMPAEWESWLRQRRDTPPTIEELARNQAIMEESRKNAELKGYTQRDTEADPKTFGSFPKYPEYEISPGDKDPENQR